MSAWGFIDNICLKADTYNSTYFSLIFIVTLCNEQIVYKILQKVSARYLASTKAQTTEFVVQLNRLKIYEMIVRRFKKHIFFLRDTFSFWETIETFVKPLGVNFLLIN